MTLLEKLVIREFQKDIDLLEKMWPFSYNAMEARERVQELKALIAQEKDPNAR